MLRFFRRKLSRFPFFLLRNFSSDALKNSNRSCSSSDLLLAKLMRRALQGIDWGVCRWPSAAYILHYRLTVMHTRHPCTHSSRSIAFAVALIAHSLSFLYHILISFTSVYFRSSFYSAGHLVYRFSIWYVLVLLMREICSRTSRFNFISCVQFIIIWHWLIYSACLMWHHPGLIPVESEIVPGLSFVPVPPSPPSPNGEATFNHFSLPNFARNLKASWRRTKRADKGYPIPDNNCLVVLLYWVVVQCTGFYIRYCW